MSIDWDPIEVNCEVQAIHPNGKIIAVPGDKRIHFWDISTGKRIDFIQGDVKSITALAYSPNGEWLASGSSWGEITLWSTSTKVKIETFIGSKYHISELVFSPDYKQLISIFSNGMVDSWSLNPAYRLLHEFDSKIVSEALQFLWEIEKDELEFKEKLHITTLLPQKDGFYLLFTEKNEKYSSLLKPPLAKETKMEQLVRFLEEIGANNKRP